MKRKVFIPLFAVFTALLIAAAVCAVIFPAAVSAGFSFPFAQIAALAEKGRLAAGLAAALGAGVCLLPLFPALAKTKTKRPRWETALWLLLIPLLAFTLYGMATPGIFARAGLPTNASGVRMTLGSTAWSAIVLCCALRLLRILAESGKGRLLRLLEGALMLIIAGVAAACVYNCGGTLYNTLSEDAGTSTIVNAALRFVVSALPYALDIAALAAGIRLVRVLRTESREGLEDAAKRLAARCRLAIGLSLGGVAAYNLFQTILYKQFSNVYTCVSVPLVSLAFLLAALLLSELLLENKRLREDNDLFI